MEMYLDKEFVLAALPGRNPNSHKGTFGSLHILAGSRPYRGAAVLCSAAALRGGAGLVRLFSTEPVCAAAAAQLPCCILYPLQENEQGSVCPGAHSPVLQNSPSAVVAGSGLGNTGDTAAVILALLEQAACPVVLDADALNILAGHLQSGTDPELRKKALLTLDERACPLILTPHIGEMARLTGLPAAEVSGRQREVAAAFAREHGCVVVLKSHITVIATPSGDLYVNAHAGNAGMAKGGSGDVLSGIIGALLAQGLPPEKAAACAVWLHATAGDRAAAQYGQAGLSPADLPEQLARLYRELGR